jgi:aminoglycoside phosphotransferase (APT) family kinase protein
LASGRDGDIFDYGPGLVLRRARGGRVIEGEARVMEYAAGFGFPVPKVHEVRAGGTEIVMEHLDGPLMLQVMLSRPWTLARGTRLLADLHDQLHQIPGPEWLPQVAGGGECLIHRDLHPLNVIMAPRGAVVIDWTGAARGDALLDVALTYVLLTCPRIPLPSLARLVVQPVRVAVGHSFVRRYLGPDLDRRIADAAEIKALDAHLSPDEVAKCRRLAARKRGNQDTSDTKTIS